MGRSVAKVLGLIAGNVAVFLLLLVGLDLILWAFAPVGKYPPSFAIRIKQGTPGLKPEITYSEIGAGLRSLSLPDLAKPEGSLRILCLGASTTAQTTQETADSWCGLLEKRLKSAHPEWRDRIHTVSYGRGGDRALETALWVEAMFEETKPDIVITLLGINDLTWGGAGKNRDVKARLAAAGPNRQSRFGTLCIEISQLCRRLQQVATQFDIRKGLFRGTKVEWHTSILPSYRENYRKLPHVSELTRNPDPIDEFGTALHSLLDFLKKKNAAVIVLGQPVLWKPHLSAEEYESLWFYVNTPTGPVVPPGSWLLREMTRYNSLQATEAQSFGFKYVDLDAALPKTVAYYFDDCHFTDKGSERVADAVFPVLESLVLSLEP
jgi:lysophospholipase L1-like esterase